MYQNCHQAQVAIGVRPTYLEKLVGLRLLYNDTDRIASQASINMNQGLVINYVFTSVMKTKLYFTRT